MAHNLVLVKNKPMMKIVRALLLLIGLIHATPGFAEKTDIVILENGANGVIDVIGSD